MATIENSRPFPLHRLMLIFAIAAALCIASQTADTRQFQVSLLDTVFGANPDSHEQIANSAQDVLRQVSVIALPVAVASLAALVAGVLTRNTGRPSRDGTITGKPQS